MPKKPFEPNFNTPQDKLCKEELNKIAANLRGPLAEELRNDKPDIIVEAEQVAKSHGIYLEFNRALSGEEKEWIYLIRISIPGGGPISPAQWIAMDDLANKHCVSPDGFASLRLTNRQNMQFHWVKKSGVVDIVRTMAQNSLFSLNGCGDNTRNVMACPTSRFSDVFNAVEWSHKAANYFRLPFEPFLEIFAIDPKYVRKPEESFKYGKQLLNRKFKIGFATVHRNAQTGQLYPDNCVEMLTNDMGVCPVIENNKIAGFQIYVGGGQGERNGKPSLASLGQALTIVPEDKLLKVMDAVVAVHQKWGDRENRFWARLKYVIKKQGIEWFRDRVSEHVGFKLPAANPNYDYGPRFLHHGWEQQPSNGLWTFGAFIENGRLVDNSPNGKLKTMVREVIQKYNTDVMITPNQDLLFTNLSADAKKTFEEDLQKYGFGKRHGKTYSTLRLHSGACVGRDTCRLTYTDSEKFEPFLIDELEQMGWGDMAESIGITGCERQCFRPATKTIGLVGSGMDRYQFKLFGDETGKFQGKPLMTPDGEQMFLRSVPRERVAKVIDVLFKYYTENRQTKESLGEYLRRIGPEKLIQFLKDNPVTADLMLKPMDASTVIE